MKRTALGVVALLATLGLTGEALASTDPLDVHGLELPDRRVASPPPASAWGTAPEAGQARVVARHLARLRAEIGPVWIDWDAERGVARGVLTSGVPAPGSIASAEVAEAHARAWLASHLDLLAPGSRAEDFELVANHLSSGIRTVGFRQRHRGVAVLGGQVSVRFKADSMVYVASQAFDLASSPPSTQDADPLAADAAVAAAEGWILADFPDASLGQSRVGERSLLPIYAVDRFGFHDVVRVEVDSAAPLARWAVYVDATTGAPVAREQLLRTAVTIRYDVPVRRPGGDRVDAPAPQVYVTESGNDATTDLAGQLELSADPSTLTTQIDGPLVDVHSPGDPASADFVVSDGDAIVWSAADDEMIDAQISAFVHTSLANAYVRAIDPELAWLDGQIDVTVNTNGTCNAVSDGDSILFMREDDECNNTARLADVVRHEFGHSVHGQSLIPGVGNFDGALSEGVADYLAATMANDSGMGRGFFKSDAPLREIDPEDGEARWPEDIHGDVHVTGLIIAGALWDLRTLLADELGEEEGVAQADHLYYEAHRRAVDIPSMYAEALVADDDDGDLGNGTPNICAINEAFSAHGLLDTAALGGSTTIEVEVGLDGNQVSLTQAVPMLADCPQDVQAATLRWRPRGAAESEAESSPMALEGGQWIALIPPQEPGTVIEFRVEWESATGDVGARPLNPADPWYQTYFGAVEPIYCLDGDADLDAWTFEGLAEGWSFEPPNGSSDWDPPTPWDDDGVALTMPGRYPSDIATRALSPVIDASGYADVRLHYRRWLAVEDATFDQAIISANDQDLWSNLDTEAGNVHHVDEEWRFHDVPLTDVLDDGLVQFDFRLFSDGGLELGGWAVDGVCVVGVVDAVCGDGIVTGDELCDDGNAVAGDGCSEDCLPEEDPGETGDDEVGDGETGGTGDVGLEGLDDGCNCTTPATSATGGPRRGSGWAGLALLVLGAGLRRRRVTARAPRA